MPLSPYMRDLRARIGHDVLRQPGAFEVVPERIVGVDSGPEFVVRYPNGDEAAESLEIRYFEDARRNEPRARFR